MIDPTLNIPKKASSSTAWIQWHKDLTSVFGKKKANSLFVLAWEKRGNNDANDSELRRYLDDQGIEIKSNILATATDKALDAFDFVGDFFTMGKYASIGLTVILVGGIGLLVYNIAKSPNTTIAALKGGK